MREINTEEIIENVKEMCFDARIHKTPQQKANRINKVCNQVNKELKVLAAELPSSRTAP